MRRRSGLVQWSAFGAVALLAVWTCCWHLGRQGINVDELVYVQAGWEYVHGTVTANLEHPPTAKYLYGLAQVLFGQGVLAPRLVAAAAVLLTGLVLFVWLRRPLGHWGALFAAGLWWLTPRAAGLDAFDPASATPVRVDRIALLEPVMVLFAVVAIAAGWAWMTTDGRRRWWWAGLAGTALGLAVTSKVTAAFVVLAIVLLPVLFRRWWDLLTGGAIAAVSAIVTFCLAYAPLGLVSAVSYMIAFQTRHDDGGHLVDLGGTTYRFAPWWTQFWWATQGTGPVLVAVVLVGAVAAVVVRPDRLVLTLVAAFVPLMVFLALSTVSLPHYYDAWMPFVLALAAVGWTRLGVLARDELARRRAGRRDGSGARRRAGRPGRPGRPGRVPVLGGALVALVAAGVVASASTTAALAVAVAHVRPAGIAVLDTELRAHGVDGGTILFTSYGAPAWRPYFAQRGSDVLVDGRYAAIVQGTDGRFPVPGAVRAFTQDEADALESFRVDDLRVWVPRGGGDVVVSGSTLTIER